MATKAAIAVRRAKAQKRLDAAVRKIGREYGIELAEPDAVIRDPELARVDELERMAKLLESLADAAPAETAHAEANAETDADSTGAPEPNPKADPAPDAPERPTRPAKRRKES